MPRTLRQKERTPTSRRTRLPDRGRDQLSSAWPTWGPADLRTAYDAIIEVPHIDWVERDPSEFVFPEPTLKPAEYFIGLSTPKHCRDIVRKLATDLRMKSVWSRLGKLEFKVKEGQPTTFLTNRPAERVACSIARRCIQSITATRTSKVLTRRLWTRQHLNIARTANKLRSRLNDEGLTHPYFQQLLTLFSAETLRAFADEVYFHLGPHAYEQREPLDLSKDPEPAKQSQEEIDAENAEWERGVEQLEYWLQDAIRRGAPKVTTLLERLEQLARSASRNPPFVGPSNSRARQVAAICDNLTLYFRSSFRSPLDEVVATIVDVLTGSGTTGAAVKVRRHRLSRYLSRSPR